jgi:HK97 family phage major capsid protein
MNPKELRDKRASLWAEMKALYDTAASETRDLTGEEQATYDRLESDLNEATENLRRVESHGERSKEFDAPATGIVSTGGFDRSEESRYDEVFETYVRHGMTDMELSDRKLLRSRWEGPESRAQGIGTTAGGYLVPPAYRQTLIERMKWYGSVRSVATVIDTGSGAPLQWPTVDDTANVGAILAENTQITQQDVAFATATLGAYKYTSKLVLVSIELLQDSVFNVQDYLQRALATRLGRITNTHYTTGTGTAQPLGIQTGAATGVTAANATTQVTAVNYNSLIDLIYTVDPAYRDPGRCKWMWNDATTGAIRKVRDDSGGAGLGRPLWEPSLRAGEPDTFLGYPVVPNNDMPVMAASAKSILFGDFASGYVIRDVIGLQQVRLDERYADFLQVGFFAFLRTDATVQNTNAYKAFVNAAS